MSLLNPDLLAQLLEFGSSLVIVIAAARALWDLPRGLARSRLVLAEGIVQALGLKVAATALKLIDLPNWRQIELLAAILATRIVLKHLFTWETKQIEQSKLKSLLRTT